MATEELIPLSNLIELKYGKGLPERDRLEGPFAVYGSNGIVGRHDSFLLDKQTIVVGRKGSVGEITLTEEHSWPIDTTYYVEIIDESKLEMKYLYYFLKTLKLKTLNTSSAVPGLNRDYVLEIEIPLPSLNVQDKITSILQRADGLRQKREHANQMINKILQALFRKMFGLQIADGKISTFGFLDVFNIKTGKLNSNAAEENGKYPFFTCSRQTFNINHYSFDCEALILSGNNAAGEYSVKHYNGKFDAYQRTYILTLKNKSHSYEYFHFLLGSKLQELKTLSIGTNTKYLTLGIMKNIQLPIPKVEHQEEFSKMAKVLEKIKDKQHESTQKTDILFDSLMSRAFKGELVTEVN